MLATKEKAAGQQEHRWSPVTLDDFSDYAVKESRTMLVVAYRLRAGAANARRRDPQTAARTHSG
jgi:hypothetical protein